MQSLFILALFLLFNLDVYAQEPETAVLRVILNMEEKGDFFVLLSEDGDVLFPKGEFLGLGFREIPKEARIEEGYISLSSLSPEVDFEIDQKESTLIITADPKLLRRQVIDLRRKPTGDVLHLSENTAFFNYSLGCNMGDEFEFESLSLPFNLGVRWGSLLGYSDFSYRKTDTEEKFVRQLTNVTKDDPGALRRYVLGDFFATSGGRLGGGGAFGGLSISKNFSMSPYFIRSPGLGLSGILKTPSDVEVYVNDIRVREERLGPGEFEFLNIPATGGVGETVLIIRDAYGREERIRTPFYLASGLLVPGLNEYSYSLGFKREEMGIESFKYEDLAFLGFYRRGLTKGLTGGLRAEADGDTINFGPTATFVLGTFGEMDTSLATSWVNGRYGCGGALGLTFPKVMGMNARLSLRGFSEWYGDISRSQSGGRPRFETVMGLGLRQRALGSISSTYSFEDRYEEARAERLSLFYSRGIIGNGSLSISCHRRWERDKVEDEGFIGLHFSMGGRRSVGLNSKIEEDKVTISTDLQKSPPRGIGGGYRFRIEGDKNPGMDEKFQPRGQAHLEYHSPYGIYSAGYRGTTEQNSYSLSVSGSLAFVERGIYFSRPIHDGFALVRVDRLKGVKVKRSNQEVGQTNRRGEVLVPGLISYYDNRLSIIPEDLPIDYSILDTTRYVSLPYRGGGVVEFEVVRLQAFEGRLFWMEDGERVPAKYAGLAIEIDGKTIETVVGKDGEFYIENLPAGRYPARLFKDGRECSFEMIIPESDDMIVDVGDIYTEVEGREQEAEIRKKAEERRREEVEEKTAPEVPIEGKMEREIPEEAKDAVKEGIEPEAVKIEERTEKENDLLITAAVFKQEKDSLLLYVRLKNTSDHYIYVSPFHLALITEGIGPVRHIFSLKTYQVSDFLMGKGLKPNQEMDGFLLFETKDSPIRLIFNDKIENFASTDLP